MVADAKAYLVHELAGEFVTDLSSASGTYQLLNVRSLRWDGFLLGLAQIDEGMLPALEEATYTLRLRSEVSKEVGVSEPPALVLGLYDGGSMVLALTGLERGVAAVNLGTSAMVRVVSTEPILDDPRYMRLQTYYLLHGTWAPGGAVNNAGVVFEWLGRLLAIDDVYALLSSLRYERPPRPIFVPLLLGERIPLLRARGTLLNLTYDTSPRELVEAAAEGIALMLAVVGEALEDRGLGFDLMVAGGGLARYEYVLQVLANVFGRAVVRARDVDAVHVGNAILGVSAIDGVHSGRVASSLAEAVRGPTYPPRDTEVFRRRFELFKRVAAALEPLGDARWP